MYYSSFRIQNFKGIKDTTIKLSDTSKMGVFAFVGLNESGKTTILEAIHSFSPDRATSDLLGGSSGVPIKGRVPRHLISNFTGKVIVSATVKLEDGERDDLLSLMAHFDKLTVEADTITDEVTFERTNIFKNGDYISSSFKCNLNVNIRTGKQKKWRLPTHEENIKIRDRIYSSTPDISYFPTFVFDFPKRIFLTEERGDKVSKFYRSVFQDILDFDGKGHTIEESIVRRVRAEDKVLPWFDFFPKWQSSDDKDKIEHVMDRASAVVTKVVFGRWNEIFGEDARGKEINISFDTIQGKVKNESGLFEDTEEHDVFIKFQVKDGTRRFDVNDRSLGFRWFFAFMLFTQFRVARENTRPLLFLFDEPASNLHAAAQQKLIESFPEIAKESHTLAYTTHSHYMIEPKWLEQTFIVSNRTDAPDGSVLEDFSLDDESLDIKAMRYRSFVNSNPSQTSYFQPILDRLQVVPSRFDIEKKSIVVEGKSDYYLLRYSSKLTDNKDFSIIPGMGAGNLSSLISLSLGWNLDMLFVLDGDPKGKEEKQRYTDDFGLRNSRLITLDEMISGTKEIENLLDIEALKIITEKFCLTNKPTKNQIRRFFQEQLAKDDIINLGKGFMKNAKTE